MVTLCSTPKKPTPLPALNAAPGRSRRHYTIELNASCKLKTNDPELPATSINIGNADTIRLVGDKFIARGK